ncbi:cell division protein FtsK [Opitutaceae bacterium TAV5]|nr:cell division protein FtsK [Opitutaceae bacterium TAV5]
MFSKIDKTRPAPFGIPASAASGAGGIAIIKPEETKKAKSPVVPASDENYQFPPVTLLKEQTRPEGADDDAEYARNMDDLVRILGEFNVAVSPGEIHVGPVITCYEVVPAPGVRVEKIASLDKNIALGMRAQSVRILAPIPGKAAVGIEMPNRTPSPVGMRDILESEDWAAAKAEIPIALGKDVSGKPLISDLSKMPHLLIAGATGSGKSVCINSIIASIVYRKAPKDLRLIMVDSKFVELKVFNSLPHMLIPVVTEPKKVPSALKWLLGEMEQRYQIFAKVGVRNISGFNHRKKNTRLDFPVADNDPATGLHATGEQQMLEGVDPFEDDDGIEIPDRLPYIVAIIDELADLMMVAPAKIETGIVRLAQLARAAGIHLIIATQRPSVNVITGVIKANLPSRIAFQVASQVDSHTILDDEGADTLIGRGDMLFSLPDSSRLVRAQGAFVSDEEVQEFVEFLKRNGPPQYATSAVLTNRPRRQRRR